MEEDRYQYQYGGGRVIIENEYVIKIMATSTMKTASTKKITPKMKDVLDITWKKYRWLLTMTATAQLTLNQKSYQLSKLEIEFHVMEEMYAALCMCGCAEKTTFLGKDD